jgi:hypothetical protein
MISVFSASWVVKKAKNPENPGVIFTRFRDFPHHKKPKQFFLYAAIGGKGG